MLTPVRRVRADAAIATFRRRARRRSGKPTRSDPLAIARIDTWARILDAWALPLPGGRTGLALDVVAAEAGVSVPTVRAKMYQICSEWAELGFAHRVAREDVRFAVESSVTSETV